MDEGARGRTVSIESNRSCVCVTVLVCSVFSLRLHVLSVAFAGASNQPIAALTNVLPMCSRHLTELHNHAVRHCDTVHVPCASVLTARYLQMQYYYATVHQCCPFVRPSVILSITPVHGAKAAQH